jgi:hypothetical protein
MFKVKRVITAAALVGTLAVAGPVAGASAAQPGTPGANIPCYPFPAFCNPSTGQPASWAPWWVGPALGLPPAPAWPPAPVWPIG